MNTQHSFLYGALTAYVLLSTAGLILMRSVLDLNRGAPGSFVHAMTQPRAIAGVVLYGASFLVWMLALRRFPITGLYPLFVGAGFVGVALGGILVLDESLTGMQILGMVLIIGGIVISLR